MPTPPANSSLPWRKIALATGTAAIVWTVFRLFFYPGFASSDGYTYMTVARSVAEGHGFLSPSIQPGLMSHIPTDATGQAYVIQQPGWTLLLAGWFKLFGASLEAASTLGILLSLLTIGLTFILGWRMGGKSVPMGWLAAALLMTNIAFVASSFALYTVPSQAFLVACMGVAMLSRPSPAAALSAGLVFAAATMLRETSVILPLGLAVAWYPAISERSPTRSKAVVAFAGLMLLVIVPALVPMLMERVRRLELLHGETSNITLRATFLYGTSLFDQGWYYIYNYSGLEIDPLQLFRDHPEELIRKISGNLSAFFQSVLLGLWTPSPWYLPLALPWLLPEIRTRRAGWGMLAAAGGLVGLSLITYTHAHYFLALLPFLASLQAVSARELMRRPYFKKRVFRWAIGGYVAIPMVVNCITILGGSGIPTGERPMPQGAQAALVELVTANTPPDAVVAGTPTSLLAWHTRRVIMQYSGHPNFRIQENRMWTCIDHQVPIDYILLSSLANETPQLGGMLMDGFSLTASVNRPDLQAWLFKRSDRPRPVPPGPIPDCR